MKKIFVFWVLLLVINPVSLFAQDSQTLLKADSLLCVQIKKSLEIKALPDSIAIYSLYLRLDLDSVNKALKAVKFSDQDLGERLFPNLLSTLRNTFDFHQISPQGSAPVYTVIVPILIAVEDYKGYEGNYRAYASIYYYLYFEKLKKLFSDLKDHYYVSFYGVIAKVSK